MDSYKARSQLVVGGKTYEIFRLKVLEKNGFPIARIPYTLRILLENLLRREDGQTVTAADIEALARWNPKAPVEREISFMPGRVLLQDFTGVPAVVDFAAMRDAMRRLGGDPKKINPLIPAELVIDHSVQVDAFGTPAALQVNAEKELERNRERYAFLRWGQKAFTNFQVVPPDTGIVHQVNLEYLARGVMISSDDPRARARARDSTSRSDVAYPDTLVGTDSHTTMINGLGILGWGVGGIEAEAAMLGQPMSMLIPEVIGFRLQGELPEGATATDLVLTVTEILRKKGVVGKFVEFFGPGAAHLSLADRATIANMAPEYGATCGFFPVDEETIRYLELTGREAAQIDLVRAYLKEQGLFCSADSPEPDYSEVLTLDLGTIEPSLAGPKRPQDRVRLKEVGKGFRDSLVSMVRHIPKPSGEISNNWTTEGGVDKRLAVADPESGEEGIKTRIDGKEVTLRHGSVVIAAITSCTNTSNPSVMIAAGLLAKKASGKGLQVKPWVKTSLAPGSQVVSDYLRDSGLLADLEKLKFHVVGYGCTTCIGNSGPLPPPISRAIEEGNLVAVSVLSGNRNFEGRINPDVRANYLTSPPLVVAYALTGRIDIDLTTEPIGSDTKGRPVYLREIWPTSDEVRETIARSIRAEMFRKRYRDVFRGDEHWQTLKVPEGETFAWEDDSTYVRHPPYFEGMTMEPVPVKEISGARVLAFLGDSVTTDHISPAGSIKKEGPAGQYLIAHGIQAEAFNSYGARRGNHEVMMRGTFANIRLKNRLAAPREGGWTLHLPRGDPVTIYDAAMKYKENGTPLIVLAGKEYGAGSSRDWAAKGPMLLGVRAVIAESFERIHRSNLVGMGILPLEFPAGKTAESLGLTGKEVIAIEGLADGIATQFKKGREVTVVAKGKEKDIKFKARVRIDTPQEVEYFRHGGILPYVLRKLLKA